MKALTTLLSFVAAAVLCVASNRVRAITQDTSPPMSSADVNDLIRRRCVVCHNPTQAKGGLNLQSFDAAKPDPDVALLMAIKVGDDGAMAAAGGSTPSPALVDEFVRLMRVAAGQRDASSRWTVDLQVSPGRGHSVVIAQTRVAADEMQLICNGATRELTVRYSAKTQRAAISETNLDGLSPTIRQVLAWCVGGSPTPQH